MGRWQGRPVTQLPAVIRTGGDALQFCSPEAPILTQQSRKKYANQRMGKKGGKTEPKNVMQTARHGTVVTALENKN